MTLEIKSVLSGLKIQKLDYFYVGQDHQSQGRTFCYPISPNYRTREEALSFLASCNIVGAQVVRASLFFREGDNLERLTQDIFGSRAA
jgi:hypothetical protein